MARIAGIDLPKNKRGEIGLTYIFGIGRSTAQYILTKAGIDFNKKVNTWNDEEQTAIRFVSPMSGGYSYLCNAMTGEWECQQDGHRLVGMFVRDLVCQVNGLPEL